MNLGYFYYKVLMDKIINLPQYRRYLETFDKELALDLEKIDEEFYQELLDFKNDILEEEFNYKGYEKKEFTLKTTAKGLFVGIGYIHEIPSVKGQFINGFYFDYTTGLPVIPGSSIKGVIRSAFPYKDEELKAILKDASSDKKFLYEEINKGKMEKIKEFTNLEDNDIFELRNEIFEYGDIFLDAYIISKGKIFDVDCFAPHKDEFSHPVPLKFLKIKEGTKFKFRFLLSNKPKILSKNKRLELFKKIIIFNGLGAKTNENYGRFETDRGENKKSL